MRVFENVTEVFAAKGEPLGTSEWLTVTQDRIDTFADATGDHQWIHVDAERAKDGPFGTTIAHGYLTLSLIPVLAADLFTVRGVRMGVNYGTEKVRFPAPVPADARVRDTAVLIDVVETAAGVRLTVRHTIEIEGSAKPACVADTLSLIVP
ncbi:MaoC family dehydratase [Streptomyces sp. SID3343]|uniref:MaoC family dehydratase n=1 Tax=Streptomyces sp. SID3343 TaxID=2690260 RepID=UPI00136BD07E|nr:MaoC family dehydratase [Streptomyces sp. SID3343]MYV99966.1 MaoC family dehydratase [Streptomyces sp. SID3343]